MSSETGRVIGIFAALVVVAAGGGYYFFGVYRPKAMVRDAQAEITDWEQTRWTDARSCLLGPTPGSSKTSEALAMRELSPDPWDRGSCTAKIAKLTRGGGPDTGLAAVEKAWLELDSAAGRAAEAFATHVATEHELSTDPLPAALDALDAARMALRSAAGLPVDAGAGKPLPVAQVLPIVDGAEPVETLSLGEVPSAHGIVLSGHTASRLVQIVLAPGKAPSVARRGPDAMRAVPDGSWGASPSGKGIQIGAMNVEGVVQSPIEIAFPNQASVLAASGTLASGLVVVDTLDQIVVVHVANGAVTQDPPLKFEAALTHVDADGTVLVVWFGADHSHHARWWQGGVAKDAEAPSDDPQMCLTADHPASTSPALLLGCAADAALGRSGGEPQQVVICSQTCRPSTLPTGSPEAPALALLGGKLVAIGEHDGVLGVWQENGTKTFYSLPEPAQPLLTDEWPMMAMTDGKVIDVVAKRVKGYAIVRIPVTSHL
jgi:hypothetical protein